MQGQMGFVSAGHDHGSTFYFEMPLYNAAFLGLDVEQATRTLLLSQNRLTALPMAERRDTERPVVAKTSSKTRSDDDAFPVVEEDRASGGEDTSGGITLPSDSKMESPPVNRLTSECTGGLSNTIDCPPNAAAGSELFNGYVVAPIHYYFNCSERSTGNRS